MQTVHVRVTDAATRQPTPCRVHFTGPDGTYYPPLGRLREFPTDPGEDVGGNLLWHGKRFAYVDGSCEVVLPPGEVSVEIVKGPEYRPIRQAVLVKPGQISLRLTLERWADGRRDGWYSGDTRASMSSRAALLEGAAEDLAVVNVLAERRDASIAHILEFSGQKPALETPGHVVVVNTLNSGGELGTLGLLNCHRPVYPLRLGGADGLVGYTLADWCDQCHRKGGLVVWCRDVGSAGDEALANLILGRIDAVEVTTWPTRDGLRNWYDLLDCGVRVPLVGGSGKASNSRLLGEPRTYAGLRPDEEFSYRAWVEAVRAGRVFVTNGPLLTFTVNGREPGSVVDLAADEDSVEVHAEARGVGEVAPIEVVLNGMVVASAVSVFQGRVAVPEGGWLAVRCGGLNDRASAHGSAVYIQRAGEPRRVNPIAAGKLLDRLEEIRSRIASRQDWEDDRQKTHLMETFDQAVTVSRHRLQERQNWRSR